MNRADQIKALRNDILAQLNMVVIGVGVQATRLYRSLISVYPDMEFDSFRKHLSYLIAKGYVKRVMPKSHDKPDTVPWTHRYFALTPAGSEIADDVLDDPALEI